MQLKVERGRGGGKGRRTQAHIALTHRKALTEKVSPETAPPPLPFFLPFKDVHLLKMWLGTVAVAVFLLVSIKH